MSLARRNPRRDANERALIDYLRTRGCLVHQLSGRGVPDLLVGWCGSWLLFEVKARGGSATDEQARFFAVAHRRGLPCYRVTSEKDIGGILDGFARRS